MTSFSQISMNFVEETTAPPEVQVVKEDQPVNVGIRIKKLKTAENSTTEPDPDQHTEPQPAPEVETELVNAEVPGKIKSGRGRKSIRQVSEEADLIQIPEDEILFRKHYYTMGEVADMFRVNQSLLRF